MKKEEVVVLAQLLTAMKDSVNELEKAYRENNKDRILMTKKELLNFQKKIDELL